MAIFKIFRETVLPAAPSLVPYAIYAVAPAAKPDYVELYITNADASAVRRVITEADVSVMIANAIGGAAGVPVVADITARNALTMASSGFVYVRDATDDATVDSGGATYLWDDANNAWVKTAEWESMDMVLSWAAIQGGPTKTPAEIDTAVNQSHTHSNKSELDKIGEDVNGDLLYGGQPVSTHWSSTDW